MRRGCLLVLCAMVASCDAFSVGAGVAHQPTPVRTKLAQHAVMGIVRQVNTAEFEAEIQDCSTPIIVDIYAVWCGPCQLMVPQLEAAAEHFGDRCRFLKVDSDEEPDVASILKINGLPTILFINDMSVVARAEGMLMADELKGLVDHHFFGGPRPEIEGFTG